MPLRIFHGYFRCRVGDEGENVVTRFYRNFLWVARCYHPRKDTGFLRRQLLSEALLDSQHRVRKRYWDVLAVLTCSYSLVLSILPIPISTSPPVVSFLTTRAPKSRPPCESLLLLNLAFATTFPSACGGTRKSPSRKLRLALVVRTP